MLCEENMKDCMIKFKSSSWKSLWYRHISRRCSVRIKYYWTELWHEITMNAFDRLMEELIKAVRAISTGLR